MFRNKLKIYSRKGTKGGGGSKQTRPDFEYFLEEDEEISGHSKAVEIINP